MYVPKPFELLYYEGLLTHKKDKEKSISLNNNNKNFLGSWLENCNY